MSKRDDLGPIDPKTRLKFRSWLKRHHSLNASAWVRVYKGAQAQTLLNKDDVVEECLCFGWVDSRPRLLDELSFELLISRRNPKSAWSAINKAKIRDLRMKGLMTPAGQSAVDEARKNGAWDKLNSSDRLEIPEDLAQAFTKNPKARTNFDAFPPSAKRPIFEWLLNAKRPETRQARIQKIVSDSARSIRTLQWRKK